MPDGDQNWEIEFTPEAERWYMRLGREDTSRMAAALAQLKLGGPNLGGPAVELIKTSRYHNMKELRSVGGNLRALFAFDPNRRAIVLLGGDKTNDWKGWYKRNIPRADKFYDRHLRRLGKEAQWPARAPRAGRQSEHRSR